MLLTVNEVLIPVLEVSVPTVLLHLLSPTFCSANAFLLFCPQHIAKWE